MRLHRPQIAEAFVRQADKNGLNHAVKELAALLLEERMHDQIEEIILDISKEYQLQHGMVEADVKTAFKLSSDIKNKLIEKVKKTTGAQKVLINEEVDSSLLAGLIISAPDMELDLSLKSKLSKLRA
ncbi:F0F1 ATP synthase subunit delta [Candidatus Nomurabacteria bacterium]|nr:F0F1 ATP synthase subunit delta [Candidatus Nomurabacteria bacterium]